MLATHAPETDLLLPLPEPGEQLDPHMIYTYASLLSVPDAGISAFVYAKCKPFFPLAEGGICIFSGFDNPSPLDMDFCDYQMTMPWPDTSGGGVALANGVRIAVLEPGVKLRLTYTSPDGRTSLDVTQTAASPLLARGHIIPGEERHDQAGNRLKGGSEQFMHAVGELVLDGERHAVDSIDCRDRSWGQVRSEFHGAIDVPPACWTPIFYPDRAFCQVGFEAPDTDPFWASGFDVRDGAPTHHNAYAIVHGGTRRVDRVRLDVHERHPLLQMPTRLTVSGTDDTGFEHVFEGEALAMAAIPTWPQSQLRQTMWRWEDQQGRTTVNSGQEMWWDHAFQHAMKKRRR